MFFRPADTGRVLMNVLLTERGPDTELLYSSDRLLLSPLFHRFRPFPVLLFGLTAD
jgi:hypothetical protein